MTKQQLIEDNIGLVHFMIRKHYPTFIGDDDIIQAGMLGLCKAAGWWDENRGPFSTLAGKCILNEITGEFRNRKKHYGLLSLDYEVDGNDGDPIPYGELLVGTNDVDFVDMELIYSRLSDFERRIFDMKRYGMNNKEIANATGCNVRKIQRELRNIKSILLTLYE